ncbi:MerR family transcriptional regulator [Ornithinibacillus xuwenensis]|uniref:MerR family DNA-binding transcriptional regulator n=1 Tax=Ornithinibacillus xuwenensis TaxID=3144668 RepID=A0ABU9XKW1_9BACI
MTKRYSISELAKQFNISTRTIRYYEEVGLLHPPRSEGGQRFFTRKEQTRLKLIFRGKRYGFTLDEIHNMLQLFDLDPSGRKQLLKTIEYGKEKIGEVSERIQDLMAMRGEMENLIEEFEKRLTEVEGISDEASFD